MRNIHCSRNIARSLPEESSKQSSREASKTGGHDYLTRYASQEILKPGNVQNTINSAEHHSYRNIPDFLKQDVNRLIEYDRLLGKLFSVSRQAPSKRNQSSSEPAATSSTTQSPETSSIEQPLQDLTSRDLETLCEFVRMDKGLPSTRQPVRRKIDKSKPIVQPKVNRAMILRNQHARKNILIKELAKSAEESVNEIPTDPLQAYLDALKRAKEAARKKLVQPSARSNRLFELRYQHNKGEPVMPSRFKEWYENYRKPPFQLVRHLELPKKYLLPTMPKNAVSLLGLSTDPTDFGQPLAHIQRIVTPDKRTRQKVRPKLKKKGKHILRRTRPSMRTGKRPWNYGTFRSNSRWHV